MNRCICYGMLCVRVRAICVNPDVQNLANNQDLLSDINNYVHAYNGFSHIATEYDTLGKVTITIEKLYSEDEIDVIDATSEMTDATIDAPTTEE